MKQDDLRRILHNIADHTEVLHRLFASGGLGDAFRGQLLTHIRFEEAENQRQLRALLPDAGELAYTVETLLQHSQMLVGLTSDTESDPALVASILHHFGEEHEWFEQNLAGHEAAPAENRRGGLGLTVGSLLDAP